jgi:subtilisin family serine protease
MENEDVDSIEEDVKVNALMNDSYSVINYTVTFNNTEFNGSGIKVAVIDTGILHNLSLFPNICCEYDFVEDDSYAQDENGHGTHVTSILASNLEPRGIAPGITVVPIRALDASGKGYASDVIKAMYYAVEQNVSVISLSLGATNSPILTETANEIVKNYNITIVVAAGNYGPNSGTITSPGDAEYVITVGAIDKNNEISYFSSRGPVNGVSKPDVVAPGVNVVTYSTNGLRGMSGTSASTPFVSGLAALLLQQNNNRTPTEIKEIIINNTVNLNCDVNVCGYGKINVGKALFENYKANKSNESNINEPLNNTENKTDKLNYSNYKIKTINVTAGDTILITYKITNPLNETKFDVTIYGINESWTKYKRKITLKENETKTEKAFIRIPINANNEALNITIVTYSKIGAGYTEPIMIYVKEQEGKDKKIKDKK